MKSVIEKLKKYGNLMEFTTPVSKGADLSDVPLPYLEFLRFSNGAELFIPGTVLHGVGSDSFPEVAKSGIVIDHDLTVIGSFSFGDLLCMEKEPPYRLYMWDALEGERVDSWESLEDFIISEIDDYEMYLKESNP